MTYIVNDNCIKCKYTDCVEVCPVDCFYEGENMLVIHPDECIDCGVCEPECPVDAIKPDTEPGLEKWLSLNAEYAKIWPNIAVKKSPPPDWKARWLGPVWLRSVSPPRSSNRTCGFPASGSPTGFTARPTTLPSSSGRKACSGASGCYRVLPGSSPIAASSALSKARQK